MRTRHARNGPDLQPRTGKDLVVSHNQRSRGNNIVWGLLTTLNVRAKFAGMGLESFVRGNVLWEGDHIRLVLTKKNSKAVSSELVKQVSANLRKIGCRCVIDEQVRKSCKSRVMSVPVHCINRFESLAVDTCSDDNVEDVPIVDSVALKTKVLASKMRKQLRLATWNVSGLCSERKQKEIADLLACNSIDIVAVQESWEKEDSKIDIDGYKWFGKSKESERGGRGWVLSS